MRQWSAPSGGERRQMAWIKIRFSRIDFATVRSTQKHIIRHKVHCNRIRHTRPPSPSPPNTMVWTVRLDTAAVLQLQITLFFCVCDVTCDFGSNAQMAQWQRQGCRDVARLAEGQNEGREWGREWWWHKASEKRTKVIWPKERTQYAVRMTVHWLVRWQLLSITEQGETMSLTDTEWTENEIIPRSQPITTAININNHSIKC